jgi:CRP/FNR family transcriptional regulator, dissimilatory nitrate respiration regulator
MTGEHRPATIVSDMSGSISRKEWRALRDAQALLACAPAKLRRVAQRRDIRTGEILFRLGDRPQVVNFVVAGEIRMIRRSRHGAEIVLQRSCRGFLAEASLGRSAYHCDAIAVEDSAVLQFPAAAFRAALDEDASFRAAWTQHLASEVRRLRAQCERLSLRSATDRIVHYIESEGTDGILILSRSRKAWASELGLTHEALYRALARLTADGALLADGRRLLLKQSTRPVRTSNRRPTPVR